MPLEIEIRQKGLKMVQVTVQEAGLMTHKERRGPLLMTRGDSRDLLIN